MQTKMQTKMQTRVLEPRLTASSSAQYDRLALCIAKTHVASEGGSPPADPVDSSPEHADDDQQPPSAGQLPPEQATHFANILALFTCRDIHPSHVIALCLIDLPSPQLLVAINRSSLDMGQAELRDCVGMLRTVLATAGQISAADGNVLRLRNAMLLSVVQFAREKLVHQLGFCFISAQDGAGAGAAAGAPATHNACKTGRPPVFFPGRLRVLIDSLGKIKTAQLSAGQKKDLSTLIDALKALEHCLYALFTGDPGAPTRDDLHDKRNPDGSYLSPESIASAVHAIYDFYRAHWLLLQQVVGCSSSARHLADVQRRFKALWLYVRSVNFLCNLAVGDAHRGGGEPSSSVSVSPQRRPVAHWLGSIDVCAIELGADAYQYGWSPARPEPAGPLYPPPAAPEPERAPLLRQAFADDAAHRAFVSAHAHAAPALEDAFARAYSNAAGRSSDAPKIHAEVQILYWLAARFSRRTGLGSTQPRALPLVYITSFKKACFFCNYFLLLFGRATFGRAFAPSQTHRKIYDNWSLPRRDFVRAHAPQAEHWYGAMCDHLSAQVERPSESVESPQTDETTNCEDLCIDDTPCDDEDTYVLRGTWTAPDAAPVGQKSPRQDSFCFKSGLNASRHQCAPLGGPLAAKDTNDTKDTKDKRKRPRRVTGDRQSITRGAPATARDLPGRSGSGSKRLKVAGKESKL